MSAGIRRADLDDIAAMLLLAERVPETPHWSQATYQALLDERAAVSRIVLVAELNGAVCGFAVGGAMVGEAELESVVVGANQRRTGIGRALCGALMQWAAHRGAKEMRLEVRASNEGALELYRRLGFVQAGVRSRYYSQPEEDAVLMHVKLPRRDDGAADL